MKAFVIGAAATKFGELWELTLGDLARDAFKKAIADSGLAKKKIEALFVANALSGILDGQANLGAFFAEELELANIPAFHLEGAGATGGLAVHAAVNSVLCGQYETVAVLGVEKMTDREPEIISRALMGAASEEERASGATLAGLFAMMARVYTREYNLAETELASAAVKNHFHASLNPNARFHNILTNDAVLASPLVADPLRLLECAPSSDGAATLIITSAGAGGVEIAASEVATDSLGLAQRNSLTELKAAQIAARKAYASAGIGANDIEVAEVHDCFSIAEIFALEDLGFFAKGSAGRAIFEGRVTLGSSNKLVVNTSGGLKGGGDPVGATGVRQIVEIVDQLKGRALARQVEGARAGLAHNVGGSGAIATIHILKK